ncbi:MAG: guanylate kinase [Acidobacteria bacterium]|nr:guanylate kinase [Acidobacteriota bacterium]
MSNNHNNSNNINRLGSLLVITAPSGAGKSTLVKRLRASLDELAFSVSYTTRPPRIGEEHSREYFFVSVSDFEKMKAEDQFLEWAKVHSNYYGTHRATVEEALKEGKDLILDIDVQGAAQIKQKMPQAVLIFIMPPSFEALSDRLRTRNLDTTEVIDRRLKEASLEVAQYPDFDYVIVNDDLDQATEFLIAVAKSERLRPYRIENKLKAILRSFPRD